MSTMSTSTSPAASASSPLWTCRHLCVFLGTSRGHGGV
jgi:hypothetical protein